MEEQNKDMLSEEQMQTQAPQEEQPRTEQEQLHTEQPQADSTIYTAPDVYPTQTWQDLYQTPDTNTEHHDKGGLFSGEQPENSVNNNDSYGMGNDQYQYGNNAQVGNQYQYGNNAQGGNQYQYGNNAQGGNQYQYGNNAQGGNQYQYGNPQYGNPYGANQYGYNNQYSPYAEPPKKNNVGLIVGIIAAVAVFFLIILFSFVAIIGNLLRDASYSSGEAEANRVMAVTGDDNDYDDSTGHNRDNDKDNDNKDNNKYDDDKYDDDYDYDGDEYYSFHDDIKDDLSYSIKWNDYEYDTDNENVSIIVNYPIVVGDDVPNLDKINSTIAREASIFSDYYEEKYSKYTDGNEDSYFMVTSEGYVTYMSENVLSVVFQEKISSDYFGAVYLYCINVDMTSGVIMENTDIIDVDDDFSVDFRIRSDEQNGTIDALDDMSDQQITKHLKSSDNLIIFYTPQGMEIGINYGDGYGWVTVTYHDYKKYLKVF